MRPDGVRVADDWDDLIKNGPHDGIFVTENGESLLGVRVWTGTAASGGLLDPAANCKAWTTLAPDEVSRVGLSGVDKVNLPAVWQQWYDNDHWTNYVNKPCEDGLNIYCFEQLPEIKP